MTRDVRDLAGKNIVVYDLEIKKPIEKCTNGWKSLDEMGISVGCLYDYRSEKYRVFMDDNMEELVNRLNEPDTLIVAFNHINFDNKLIRASGYPLKEDNLLRNYDMLQVSRVGAGEPRGRGFSLDSHLKTLNLPLKTANGALAPIWYQEGKIGKVVDYCLNDVMQEKALFEYMYANERLACEAKPDFYPIVPPQLEYQATLF